MMTFLGRTLKVNVYHSLMNSKNIIDHLDQFISNDENKNEIRNFLNCKGNDAMIIISENGLGKTTFCKCALKEYITQLNIYSPCIQTIYTHKQLVENIEMFINVVSTNKTTKLIYIDDIDILFSCDRYANSYILQTIKKKVCKVLITCSYNEEKRVADIKKHCKILHLLKPSATEIMNIIGGDNKNDIIEKCNNNLLNIYNQNIDLNYRYFGKNIYQIVENLFIDNDGLANLEYAISSDPSLISFMMYDNYFDIFKSKFNMNFAELHQTFNHINKTYIDTLVQEDFAFYNIDWNLIEILNLIRCQMIRLEQEKYKNLQKKKIKQHTIKYTNITSRSAQHYNVIKKYSELDLTFNNLGIYAELMYTSGEKIKNTTGFGVVCNSYIYNYCKER